MARTISQLSKRSRYWRPIRQRLKVGATFGRRSKPELKRFRRDQLVKLVEKLFELERPTFYSNFLMMIEFASRRMSG